MGSDPQSHLQVMHDLEHEACKKTEAELRRQLAEFTTLMRCGHVRACLDVVERGCMVCATQTSIKETENLLAIIHRDGGQHTTEVGLVQSVKDAHTSWGEAQARIAQLATGLGSVARDRSETEARIAALEEALRSILNLAVPMGSDYGHADIANIAAAALSAQPPAITDTQRLEAEVERLTLALGKVAAAVVLDQGVNECYHHAYVALVKDLTLPAEQQRAIMTAAIDAAMAQPAKGEGNEAV
jgi:hypothetical protein